MWIELHCHSTCSDGSVPPGEVAWRAARRGVQIFCLTDHDTCAGYPATVGTCPHVIRGVELSCMDAGRSVHVLVYDAARDDDRWAELEAVLETMREARKSRARAIALRLAGFGITIDVEPLIAAARGRTVGRPDIARLLVAAGAVSSIAEAFDRYLGDDRPANVKVDRLTVAEGLALGQRAGGRMSLAHPHTLGDRAVDLVRAHRHRGLDGLECYYGATTQRQRRRWLLLARELDMVVTGGSDFHGETTPQIAEPGVAVPDACADRVRAWLDL